MDINDTLRENAKRERDSNAKDLYDMIAKFYGITPGMSRETVFGIIDKAFDHNMITFQQGNLIMNWIEENNIHEYEAEEYKNGSKVYERKVLKDMQEKLSKLEEDDS